MRKSYSALLVFSMQLVRFSCEEEIRNILGKQNLKSDRIDYFVKSFNSNKEGIVKSLKNTNTSWPNLIDANWRLDFILKVLSFSGFCCGFFIGKPGTKRNLNGMSILCIVSVQEWQQCLCFLFFQSNAQNHIGKPLYFIILSTAKEGKVDYIKFTCDLHQLQDLCTKVKEIVSHIEKLSNV